MTGRTSPPVLSPQPFASGELQSSITLLDFFRAWHAVRFWFIAGFLLVLLGSYGWVKLAMTKFYRAEARIFVGRQIAPEQRIGFIDVEQGGGGRNEQYQNQVQTALAEQYLGSADVLLDVTRQLAQPDPNYGGRALDLYELLGIREPDPKLREMLLVKDLRTDLMQIRVIPNSGVVQVAAEMPSAEAAKRFVDACIRVLQQRFADLDFSYYRDALRIYRERLAKEQAFSDQRAAEMAEWQAKHQFDLNESVRKERDLWKEELDARAKWLAQLKDKIQKLELATSEAAVMAASPVKVVDWANLPIKVSRPKASITAVMAAALFSFVFMIGLVVMSYLQWSRRYLQAGREDRD